jgi:hypothetical protein
MSSNDEVPLEKNKRVLWGVGGVGGAALLSTYFWDHMLHAPLANVIVVLGALLVLQALLGIPFRSRLGWAARALCGVIGISFVLMGVVLHLDEDRSTTSVASSDATIFDTANP